MSESWLTGHLVEVRGSVVTENVCYGLLLKCP